MKRFRILAVTLSLLALVVILVIQGEPKAVIFPDEKLDTAIRDALGKPVGEKITVDELAELTTLDAPVSGITDLSGLEYCTNLIWLELWENQISDISPVSSLTNLTLLDLFWNEISDISAISSLTDLILLDLSRNRISDISPVSSLTNLTELYLEGNKISDITPISSLTNLTELSLDGNKISDITPLVKNGGLGEGDVVWLKDNNLDLREGSEDMENIKALEDRGVFVSY